MNNITLMPKSEIVQLRVREEVKEDLRRMADYRGLTISSYLNMLVLKTIRQERSENPEVFKEEIRGQKLAPKSERKIPLVNPQRRKTG